MSGENEVEQLPAGTQFNHRWTPMDTNLLLVGRDSVEPRSNLVSSVPLGEKLWVPNMVQGSQPRRYTRMEVRKLPGEIGARRSLALLVVYGKS